MMNQGSKSPDTKKKKKVIDLLMVYNGRRPRRGLIAQLTCSTSEQQDAFLQVGLRPHGLSAVPLAVWTQLTTSIQGFQAKLETQTRIFVVLSIIYMYRAGATLGPAFFAAGPIYCLGFLAIIAFIGYALRHFIRMVYVEGRLHPAVQGVVNGEELQQAFAACGFELEYVVERGCILGVSSKQYRSHLRFTHLHDTAIV